MQFKQGIESRIIFSDKQLIKIMGEFWKESRAKISILKFLHYSNSQNCFGKFAGLLPLGIYVSSIVLNDKFYVFVPSFFDNPIRKSIN